MKVDIDQYNNLRLREVFSGVLLETGEGNQIGVCMRDDTLEINVCPCGKNTDNWWRVNMQTGRIENMHEAARWGARLKPPKMTKRHNAPDQARVLPSPETGCSAIDRSVCYNAACHAPKRNCCAAYLGCEGFETVVHVRPNAESEVSE